MIQEINQAAGVRPLKNVIGLTDSSPGPGFLAAFAVAGEFLGHPTDNFLHDR